MLQFTKRFQGSYYAILSNGKEITLQSYAQYSGLEDKDYEGFKWVLSIEGDWDNDCQFRAMTKKECVQYANEMHSYFEELEF